MGLAKPTYSVAQLGIASHHPYAAKAITIPDTSGDGMATNGNAALAGIMAAGDTLVCKGPDGSLATYRIDAERSNPQIGQIYLLRV